MLKSKFTNSYSYRYFRSILKIFYRGTWSKEEDYELLKLAKEKGKKWSEIARLLNGRTENSVKNRYHALFRKEIEKNEDFLMK